MNDLIFKFFRDKDGENLFFPPATDIQIKDLENKLVCTLPQDYKEFLMTTNGFDGFIGEFYAVFESVDKILECTKESCSEFFPWAIYIGTNGNLEMFVMDKRTNPYTYGLLPFIADDDDFIPLSDDFGKFIHRLFEDKVFNK
jgi:cell wall assembly regulator SMI1